MMQSELKKSRRAEEQNLYPVGVAVRWSQSLSLNAPLMLKFASHPDLIYP